ncbi:MAG TPA: hypothetical protein VFN46_00250, partial [Acetobacteraceae bacterium]|nr:hypothetical protein [Acetobacteraceae bacterium]
MPLTAPPREPLEPPGIEPSTRAEPAEHAVRESEARLRVALAIAGLGAWETDFAAGHTTWDAGTAALLRVPHDQSEAYAGRWLDFVHPHDRARVEHAVL